jgi:GNAT superfamily N-acetyltransferase
MDDFDLTTTQMIGAWQAMCAASPGYVHGSDNGLEYVFSGLPIAFFNVAIVARRGVTAAALSDAARRACPLAASQNAPWLFVVTHEGLNDGVDAAQTLDPIGLVPLMPLTGMVAEAVEPPGPLPEGLQIEVPRDEDRLAAVLSVNALAYGMDLASGQSLMATPSYWTNRVPVVGSVDGKAVCTTAVFMVDGYRYVALVATDPAYQRRGYADAVMRHALKVAADMHGPRPTVLHATDAGRPVYERMGYRPIARHTLFIEKRFLEGH